MNSCLNIIFAGTPEFAVPSLRQLINSQHRVIAVYTQPDRPAGRGRQLHASPVKQAALTAHIPVFQPSSLKDETHVAQLKQLQPDVIVVIAYGQLLTQTVLDIPKFGCINVHASLLPRWRGAAPIQRALLADDKTTGICIMQMEAGLDTGPIILSQACDIQHTDTAQDLHDKLAHIGQALLLETLNDLEAYLSKATPQEDRFATYAKKLSKDEALIDWSKPAKIIERQIRAYNPWPISFTVLNNQRIRIYQAHYLDSRTIDMASDAIPGSIIQTSDAGIDVATGEGILRILRLQLPGGKVLSVSDILHAKRDLFSHAVFS